MAITKEFLEELYLKRNRREYVHPDPLEFLYNYPQTRDREIAGLIASSLAYGRVHQILKSVSGVLKIMTPSPYLFLKKTPKRSLLNAFSGFKHRFTAGKEIAGLLAGIKNAVAEYGSLYECFTADLKKEHDATLPALESFISKISGKQTSCASLLPCPGKKSAFKRMNLFLRWMVRKDAVDPGGWEDIGKTRLLIPLDVHMHSKALEFKFTKRRQTGIKTVMEITSAFRRICPEDPVKYDFCLTREGIMRTVNGRRETAHSFH